MMKKRFGKILLSGFLSLSTLFALAAPVSAVQVVKSFKYDHNTILNYDTNYHDYTYKNIPDSAYYHHQSRTKVGGGWNYNRYQVIKYYKGSTSSYY